MCFLLWEGPDLQELPDSTGHVHIFRPHKQPPRLEEEREERGLESSLKGPSAVWRAREARTMACRLLRPVVTTSRGYGLASPFSCGWEPA